MSEIGLKYVDRRTKKTDLGDNEYYISLPQGARLRAVSAKNVTTFFRPTHIEITSKEHTDETLGLVSSATQIANRSVGWIGDITMGLSYRTVKVTFHRCLAGDDLAIRVGYE